MIIRCLPFGRPLPIAFPLLHSPCVLFVFHCGRRKVEGLVGPWRARLRGQIIRIAVSLRKRSVCVMPICARQVPRTATGQRSAWRVFEHRHRNRHARHIATHGFPRAATCDTLFRAVSGRTPPSSSSPSPFPRPRVVTPPPLPFHYHPYYCLSWESHVGQMGNMWYVLGYCWVVMRASWGTLGSYRGSQGHLGAILDRRELPGGYLGAVLGRARLHGGFLVLFGLGPQLPPPPPGLVPYLPSTSTRSGPATPLGNASNCFAET